MHAYIFATSYDGDKFLVRGETIQAAFESLAFRAEDYASDGDSADYLRGKEIKVWGWDEDDKRFNWMASFS